MEREIVDYEEAEEEGVPSLPSRRDLRQSKRSTSRKKKKKKRIQIEFPLMRICLLLFFTLVVAMFTYPVWIKSIP